MTPDPEHRLADLVRVYDKALEKEFCDQVIGLFESDPDNHFRRSDQSSWVEYIITRNRRPEWREIERKFVDNMIHYLKDYSAHPAARMLGLRAPRAFEHLKMKKYEVGQEEADHFPLHVDAYNKRSSVRMIGFLWYLNTVTEGGETTFPVIGPSISPKAGRLVLLPPMWMYEHFGQPPVSADKYIVTSYLNFWDPEDDLLYSYPLR
jgi:hypothetical protein